MIERNDVLIYLKQVRKLPLQVVSGGLFKNKLEEHLYVNQQHME
ncbi:hypothetical protein IQ10_00809 [Halalkalibacter nanhaiisediminis]|uniref:Uncharacterized protein n=1 Tax=Halalkalibacter nanhaiisediminis TaxID=688079 RepID=A0A562QQW3_9BACI|nr:hypothetical protein IQ10_00809 [Halalkalibacter nanhaiisediminis]